MEPLDLIAAKLVLGYLRSAKCKTAHKEFLKTSSNLRHLDYSKTKYMPTRFLGQTLEDILIEYFEISQIIQGRLEATNFYNENHSKTSLQEQLLYLLNNKVFSSRASTPVASTSYGSCGNYMSPNHSDLEATPVHTLPGNAESEESFNLNESPKRKLNSRSERHTLSSPNVSPIEKTRREVFDTEVLAQNLMDNREFQEKIAHTINKVVERQYKERNPEELDKTVKCAVEEAEADPIFEDLLREIMGSSNMLDGNKHSELANTTSSNKEKKKDSTTDVNSSISKNKSQVEIETQNIDVTRPVQPDKEPIMTYDNPFDNYIISNNCSLIPTRSSCVQNPLFINTVTGLLIPSVTTTVNPTKPVILLNQPAPVVTPTALTEEDIMKMPIILNENDQVMETGKQKKGNKRPKMLLPQPTIHLAPEASDDLKSYFKNYAPPETKIDTGDSPALVDEKLSVSTEINSSKSKTGLKKVIYPKVSRKSPRPKKRVITDSQMKKEEPGPTDVIVPNEDQNQKEREVDIANSTEKLATPAAPSDNVKKPTPKSGSHVRNLNFSTPPKSRRKSEELKCATIQKNQAVKTLFQKAWDADLRAVIPNQDKEDLAPKKQQTTIGSKKTRKKRTNSNSVTEKEGLLLEAAIKTPIKPTDKNSENKTDTECMQDEKIIILSPSKLHNTSKNILEAKNTEGKFITPDMPKQNDAQPMAANRNIMPMLETPIKIQLPKTPGISTPADINMSNVSTTTPFTKMLEANLDLKGIDIGSIPTPNLPITPNFAPFTPTVDLISPYSNRPTDYSTGSSYYQPSDNEQNKNLEAHLREIEKASTAAEVTLNDHLQSFNKNIIGKKNLSLVKTNMESDHSFDSSSNEDSSFDGCNKESNDTVIFRKENDIPKKTYSLRNRNKGVQQSLPIKSVKTSSKAAKTPKIKKSSKNISQTTTNVEEIASILQETKPTERGVTPSQLSVLKDLENKRLRMVNSLKPQIETNSKIRKPPNSKFKIKPIAKVYTTKKSRKSDSPKKKKRNRDIDIVLKDLITSDDSDVNISLSLSDGEDKIEKENTNDKTASDVEAQTLIEGLKERGIHLMQNKSPKKNNLNDSQINSSGTQLEMFDRDSFDTVNIDGCLVITYDEAENRTKKVPAVLEEVKKVEYIGQLYLESIGGEIQIHLKQTDFHTLLDIKPQIKNKSIFHNQGKTDKHQISDEVKKKVRKESNSKSGDIKRNEKPSTENKKDERPPPKSNSKIGKTKCKETEGYNVKINDVEKKKERQFSESKSESKQLIESKKDKQSPKTAVIEHDLENPIKSVSKESMKDKHSPENRKEVTKKRNSTDAKHSDDKVSSNVKKTKQKPREKQINEIKNHKQVNENKMQLPNERTKMEKKTCESEILKPDRSITENKDRLPETKSIFGPHLNNKDPHQSSIDRDIEDELMNFASTGKDQEDVSAKSVSKKRRLSDEILTEHSCKKMLRTLDVDSFLNKIHADTSMGSRK